MSAQRAPSHSLTVNEARRIAEETDEYIPGLPDDAEREGFYDPAAANVYSTVAGGLGSAVRFVYPLPPLRTTAAVTAWGPPWTGRRPVPLKSVGVPAPRESRLRRALRVLKTVSRA